MYNTSAEFNTAVFENSPEENILFRFNDGTIFTNEDIHLDSGVRVVEGVNFNEELTIGTCNSSNLTTTIMNYHRLLSGYEFGECAVSLGVKLRTDSHDAVDANAWVVLGYGTEDEATITCHSTPPYIKLNNIATTAQPNFPVMALYSDTGGIHCIGEEGQTWSAMLDAFAPGELDPIDFTFNAFMTNKLKLWAQDSRGVVVAGDMMYEFFVSGNVDVHEFAPLGVFVINTPLRRKIDLIAIDAFDRMSLFDVSAEQFIEELYATKESTEGYSITLSALYYDLCDYVGVTSAYIEEGFKFYLPKEEESVSFQTGWASGTGIKHWMGSRIMDALSAKDILSWIAEAVGASARMTRDGKVELAWYDYESIELVSEHIFSIDVAEHQVQPIDQVIMTYSTGGSEERKVSRPSIPGVTYENTYVFANNPFIMYDKFADGNMVMKIFRRFSVNEAFTPIMLTAVCNWAIQAGDIISVEYDNATYSLPIYCQTIVWNGGATATYENSGQPKRPAHSSNRTEKYIQDREFYDKVNNLKHSELVELDADDHPQYYNATRGDARYWKLANLEVLIGYTVVTPDSANTNKAVSITFSTEFSGTPRVVCTPNTNAASTVFVGANALSTTGFTLNVQRPNTSAIGIHWIAIWRA